MTNQSDSNIDNVSPSVHKSSTNDDTPIISAIHHTVSHNIIHRNDNINTTNKRSIFSLGNYSNLQRVRQSPTTVLVVVSGALFVDLLVYSIVIPGMYHNNSNNNRMIL